MIYTCIDITLKQFKKYYNKQCTSKQITVLYQPTYCRCSSIRFFLPTSSLFYIYRQSLGSAISKCIN